MIWILPIVFQDLYIFIILLLNYFQDFLAVFSLAHFYFINFGVKKFP